ncbi:MAG TPA: DNA-binding response regulator [Marinilabiliales bacterium]|jgi:DNA-binding response OmpR family regulator|nr:MAG: DNA-binding response regulator [Bacteroidetes bacterium GWA2_40_14]OFX57139.1 MAG: DNA-binding response regulator [Bacteroidetes bacterium GWC2_40_13]OFX73183.1 MAG: DNA-binding response regulator [Bacteroidetes bacterium GWD2_40_43]OFX91738.1 MAG: DNA-binding response regulator [Bacteroidetes bacterium GWE2_40_63]OFY24548.1 MAG: DNA-binding response regulator [Bacteroidetes bacterium GWF2_40_13]OFZ23814.1 MAG: DNA-binding response regulator [Bacteroidetes bacterium RIFOXYC2_FULL_40_12
MIKILIVEDEVAMLKGLQDNLEFEGYAVDTANNGKDGLQKMLTNKYHLALLDVMMPELSGFDVCKTARGKGIKTPVIMLTAKAEEIDKVLGLELGADDYITKPFSLRELLARIRAILRRAGIDEPNEENRQVEIGNMKVNFALYVATVQGEEVKLSHKEFEILHYLFVHKNETVSRDDLLNNVWGTDYQPTSRTIDNFVLKLRQKIEKDPNDARIILTVHGVGYKLIL